MRLSSGLGSCVLVVLSIISVVSYKAAAALFFTFTCTYTLSGGLLHAFMTYFQPVGLILLLVGVILKYWPGVLFKFLFEELKDITHFDVPKDYSDLNNVPILNDLGKEAISLGVFLLGRAILACVGAGSKWKPVLAFLCVLAICLILAVIIVGALYLCTNSPMHKKLRTELSKEVSKSYKGPKNSDAFSLLINIFSYSMNCCGMNGPGDFNTSAPWTRYQVDKTHTMQIDVTPACCIHTYLENNDLTCAQNNTAGMFDTKKTNTAGCYDKILSQVKDNQFYAIVTIAVIISLLSLEIVVTGALMKIYNGYSRVAIV